MYILKYYYFHRNPETYRAEGNVIWGECSGMKLSKVMEAYRAGGADHDLIKYTSRTIYDVTNTAEK